MAMSEEWSIKYHIKTEKTQDVNRDTQVEFEADSFDFGDRFDMDFDAGF